MRVYFLSARPCALKINGAYLGIVDGFARFIELEPREMPFCELLPLDGRWLPVLFEVKETLAAAPPRGAAICFLPDGIAVYAKHFLPADLSLCFLGHAALSFGKITLFAQGLPQALFEGRNGYETTVLDDSFASCTVHELKNAVLLEGKEAVCLLDKRGKALFSSRAYRWTYDAVRDELRLLVPLRDFRARTAEQIWRWKDEKPVAKTTILPSSRVLPKDFLLCELLQELSCGGDIRPFLCGDLYAAGQVLKDFFGSYARVLPLSSLPFGAGTVCQKRENVYEWKGFSAVVEQDKIVNVRRVF